MKKVKLKYQLLFSVILISQGNYGQMDSLSIKFETGAVAGQGENLPFWLQTNRFGILDNDLSQAYGRLSLTGPFDPERNISLSYGLTLAGQISDNSDLYPEEYFAALKFHFLVLEAGARKKYFRDYPHEIGSGDMIWSGNSRPIPEISLSTFNFVDVPFTSGWLLFDAGLSHGWMDDFPGVEDVLLHHKWFSLKTGDQYPLQLTMGLQHFAQWGGYSSYYGEMPVSFEAYWKVLIASGGISDSPDNEQINAIGNHIGSYQIALDYDFSEQTVGLNWQHIFEDNSGRRLKNFPDGLYSLWFKSEDDEDFISQAVIEFIATDNQSGRRRSDTTINTPPPTGDDDYFRNYIYLMGWTQDLRTIGTPFITSPVFHSDEDDPDRVINNRVRAMHIGFGGNLGFMKYKILYSHTINKGRYRIEFNPAAIDNMLLVNLNKEDLFIDNSIIHFEFGFDRGDFYGNNIAFMLRWVQKWGIKR
ncbi:MAG: capsule assembly Wzi family protein [bacterium]